MNTYLIAAAKELEAKKALTEVRLAAAREDVVMHEGQLVWINEALEKMKTIIGEME